MHNAQARLRAVETGRYVLRSANTGVSSVITPQGVVTDLLPALEEGILVADVTLCEHTTLYVRIGNAFVYACIAFAVVLLGSGAASAYKKSKVAK
jgi:apolipoprotein N-acyltransferase